MNDNTEEYCRECQHPHVNERLRAENHKLKEMNTQDNTAPEAKHTPCTFEEYKKNCTFKCGSTPIERHTCGCYGEFLQMQKEAMNDNTESMKTGIELIAQERKEQIEKHGRTIELDVELNDGFQLSQAAEMLLAVSHEEGIDPLSFPDGWDYEICQKMIGKTYKERLIIAGALIAAEIDRLQS